MTPGLLVIETHPIQYHAPVWRAVQQEHGIPVTAIYGSDFSVAGYRDAEFNATFSWDTDLLSGYTPVFLSRLKDGGARNDREVTARGLADALRRVRPRAVLSVGYSPRFHSDAFRAARRARLPVLFRGETTDHAQRRGVFKALARDTALRWLYRRCAALLHVGRHSREHFRRLGFDTDERRFSPYCVDTAPFRMDDMARAELRGPTRRELGVTDDQHVIAFCGKLSPRKGPDLLLDALRRLPERDRARCVLLLVGDGELKGELLTCAVAAPSIAVRHVGFKQQRELSAYYHSADLFVLPSRHGETWGLVVNEALHHGVPAVVSEAVGCAPDLIDPGCTGEVCAANSAEALATAMRAAWPLMRAAAIRAVCRERVAGYSISRAAVGIAAAYRQVTATPATGAGL
jgi:glycosyltransferase involved in cell wall biosynthesis